MDNAPREEFARDSEALCLKVSGRSTYKTTFDGRSLALRVSREAQSSASKGYGILAASE